MLSMTPTPHAAPPGQSAPASAPPALPILLSQAIDQVERLGPEFTVERQKLEGLRQRLVEKRFHLAVLGQFKRGKSTLLNALLGEALLPTSVVPLTAVPTFLRSGSARRARVIFQNGRPAETFAGGQVEDLAAFLVRFGTEEGNPHNHLDVSHIEVFHPAPLLRQGVVLIDTPGIGSTLRHNTEATLGFLPHCDAALFLVSADPPITEVEVAFLKEVQAKVARLFFVLNKADYLDPDERQTALDFFRGVLQTQAGFEGPAPVFCVSARQGLQARQRGDTTTLWAQSGLAEVEDHLLNFLVAEKTEVLQTALARKAADLIADVLLRLQLTLRSLQMPLTTLAERLQLFEQKLVEAEQQRLLAGDLLAGDQRRLVAFLEEQAEQLRQKARAYLSRVVEEALAETGAKAPDERAVQDALAGAIPGFFERELDNLKRTFERQVAEALPPHRRRAEELVETVRRNAAELFDIPYQALAGSDTFMLSREPYWVTQQGGATLSPFPPGLMERLLPAGYRRSRLRRRLADQIETLTLRNVENLRWATLQSLDQTCRRFRAALDERLRETIAATQGAIQIAYARRQEQTAAIAAEVAHLESAGQALEQIQAGFKAFSRLD